MSPLSIPKQCVLNHEDGKSVNFKKTENGKVVSTYKRAFYWQ